jgi:hypothetical protein
MVVCFITFVLYWAVWEAPIISCAAPSVAKASCSTMTADICACIVGHGARCAAWCANKHFTVWCGNKQTLTVSGLCVVV